MRRVYSKVVSGRQRKADAFEDTKEAQLTM